MFGVCNDLVFMLDIPPFSTCMTKFGIMGYLFLSDMYS
jgi:hypothetical protein